MVHQAKWVLSCKNCHSECTYAQIPEDSVKFFLPKKPQVPDDFTFTCRTCGHSDKYRRKDLIFRDETMPSYFQPTKCA
jgi:hypothetical protein